MIIRQATEADAPSIATIANYEISDTLTTFRSRPRAVAEIASEIASKADTGLPFFVSGSAGAIQGFATYAQFRANDGYRHTMEHSVAVLPTVQGRGLGRALMGALISRARTNDVHSLIAGISAQNQAGIAFHTALGFLEVGRLPETGRKNDRWLDLVLMQLLL